MTEEEFAVILDGFLKEPPTTLMQATMYLGTAAAGFCTDEEVCPSNTLDRELCTYSDCVCPEDFYGDRCLFN